MTIKSMTGFGRGEVEQSGRIWTVEIRCVNNRFLDVKIKLPRGYVTLEERLRKKISEFHLRGRVDVTLNVQGDFSDLQKVTVNTELAKIYRKSLALLARELNIEDDTSLSQMASFPEILIRDQEIEDIDKVWQVIEPAITQALVECEKMRLQEGACLVDDVVSRLNVFEENVKKVEDLIPLLVEKREQSLKERLAKLLENIDIDPMRLAQEVAIMVDKTDVTEEVVRLRSHMMQFTEFLREEGAVGRKLDFLLQEFLREVNTLASKINDAGTAHITVELKNELERIREQVQNIE